MWALLLQEPPRSLRAIYLSPPSLSARWGNWVLPRKLLAICPKAGVGHLGSWGPCGSAVGPWWLNLLHLTACQYLNLVFFKEAAQAFVRAVCLNLGLWPESINPINVQEWEGWKCLICASCWHHLILSFWNEPIYDWMLQCKFCK